MFVGYRENEPRFPVTEFMFLFLRVLTAVHQRLGTVDVDDQIAALEYVTHFVQ